VWVGSWIVVVQIRTSVLAPGWAAGGGLEPQLGGDGVGSWGDAAGWSGTQLVYIALMDSGYGRV
jgi:hypothetical protein